MCKVIKGSEAEVNSFQTFLFFGKLKVIKLVSGIPLKGL